MFLKCEQKVYKLETCGLCIMNISSILSTKERIRILESVLFREDGFGVNEIAKQLKLSKALVSKYFDILIKGKILVRMKKKFYVSGNVRAKSLKILLNLQKFEPRIFKKYKFVKSAGVYGSCAKGTNTENSDVDLWVKVDKLREKEIVRLGLDLRRKISNIKILFLDDEKIMAIKKDDPIFYYSLYFGSIIIYGGEDEI
ncbi:hypothetical protein D6829_01135 [Candidatus Pacearchaeota archaeon]|nr:MAG: hypothetical protein D6829_01135 [Candidatus Pacearchaeota archaeon]